jgi:hypothetical protein
LYTLLGSAGLVQGSPKATAHGSTRPASAQPTRVCARVWAVHLDGWGCRYGQAKAVYVYRLLAAGTMEEKIYDRQVCRGNTAPGALRSSCSAPARRCSVTCAERKQRMPDKCTSVALCCMVACSSVCRQITKQSLALRVVDELEPSRHFTFDQLQASLSVKREPQTPLRRKPGLPLPCLACPPTATASPARSLAPLCLRRILVTDWAR